MSWARAPPGAALALVRSACYLVQACSSAIPSTPPKDLGDQEHVLGTSVCWCSLGALGILFGPCILECHWQCSIDRLILKAASEHRTNALGRRTMASAFEELDSHMLGGSSRSASLGSPHVSGLLIRPV